MTPRFFRATHFRLSLWYTLIFSGSVVILGLVTIFFTSQTLENQLKSHVHYNATQLMGDYEEDGLEELRHDIEERLQADVPERLWYALLGPDGVIQYDKIPRLPSAGWHVLDEGDIHLLLLTIDLKDGYRFGVGVGLDKLQQAERALRNAFMLAVLATLSIGAIAGYLVSSIFLKNVERIQGATLKIGDGDLSHRLPLNGSGDEFDQLSSTINAMFARIETLVNEVQRVSSNIAHDLRTPLGRMKQKIELILSREDLQEPVRQKVEEISDLLDSTLDVFSALLRIAEVESGSRKSAFRTVEVSELFNNVSSAYEAVAEDSGRRITFECDSTLKIRGDFSLLMQLIVNLIENALQHTPPGTSIAVMARRFDGHAQIEVADSGPGLPPEERARVFEPFYKYDRSRSSQRGSGLGLSLVAAIAKLHDGALVIEDNQPGLLVRFTVKTV